MCNILRSQVIFLFFVVSIILNPCTSFVQHVGFFTSIVVFISFCYVMCFFVFFCFFYSIF